MPYAAPHYLCRKSGKHRAGSGCQGNTRIQACSDLIACANGILNLKTRELRPHDALFFTPNALTFAFDPNAPEPKQFAHFLDTLRLDEEMEDASAGNLWLPVDFRYPGNRKSS